MAGVLTLQFFLFQFSDSFLGYIPVTMFECFATRIKEFEQDNSIMLGVATNPLSYTLAFFNLQTLAIVTSCTVT